ncbi:MAG TPA: transglutaminase-like domain-containing protein [Gemmataceae bacterium]|nr:transglutaminase-like domain-containing protein [Gemmataceae bacterium]
MNLDETLSLLARDSSAPVDLAAVALHLARDEYPDLDVEAYLSELAAMAHEARSYLRGDLRARVAGLCRYLFHEMGFRGNTQSYYDPRNSYLNQVLDRRTGIPITLSVVAMTVGTRAGLAVDGVGLPGHFIARAAAAGQEIFFDPFHGGRFLTPEQCAILVQQVTGLPFEATAAQLRPAPVARIVLRMLSNLKSIYLRQGDFPRAIRVIERARQLAPDDPEQRRDLGISLVRVGQPGRALDHLEAYLAAMPAAADASAVREFLDQARSEVARWN